MTADRLCATEEEVLGAWNRVMERGRKEIPIPGTNMVVGRLLLESHIPEDFPGLSSCLFKLAQILTKGEGTEEYMQSVAPFIGVTVLVLQELYASRNDSNGVDELERLYKLGNNKETESE